MSILCYHSVHPTWESNLAVKPEAFAAQCEWLLRKRGVVELDQVVAAMKAGRSLAKLTALTFDDGFADFYEHAWPVLMRYRLPCTVFLVAGNLLQQETVATWVDDAPTPLPRTLSLEQVLELKQVGVRFGSHSYAHRDLTELSEYECELDLRESRELLEDLLSVRIRFLAYPRGKHDETVRRAAHNAGFTHAFAMMRQADPFNRYSIPRVGIFGHNGLFTLEVKTSPWYLQARTHQILPLAR
jgi:peptidoglycan/xylan/chitin deacetylase (PgdA/CDA1 family)